MVVGGAEVFHIVPAGIRVVTTKTEITQLHRVEVIQPGLLKKVEKRNGIGSYCRSGAGRIQGNCKHQHNDGLLHQK
jgi:hypothetical protein